MAGSGRAMLVPAGTTLAFFRMRLLKRRRDPVTCMRNFARAPARSSSTVVGFSPHQVKQRVWQPQKLNPETRSSAFENLTRTGGLNRVHMKVSKGSSEHIGQKRGKPRRGSGSWQMPELGLASLPRNGYPLAGQTGVSTSTSVTPDYEYFDCGVVTRVGRSKPARRRVFPFLTINILPR